MVNSLRFKDEPQRHIREDAVMPDLKHDDISIVEVQMCLYCLYILIKKPLEDYKHEIISWKDLVLKSLENQNKFIDEIGKRNRSYQPISQDVYKKFFRDFEIEEDDDDTEVNVYSRQYYKCLKNNKYEEFQHSKRPSVSQKEIANQIVLDFGGTATIIDDVLTPYTSEGM